MDKDWNSSKGDYKRHREDTNRFDKSRKYKKNVTAVVKFFVILAFVIVFSLIIVKTIIK